MFTFLVFSGLIAFAVARVLVRDCWRVRESRKGYRLELPDRGAMQTLVDVAFCWTVAWLAAWHASDYRIAFYDLVICLPILLGIFAYLHWHRIWWVEVSAQGRRVEWGGPKHLGRSFAAEVERFADSRRGCKDFRVVAVLSNGEERDVVDGRRWTRREAAAPIVQRLNELLDASPDRCDARAAN